MIDTQQGIYRTIHDQPNMGDPPSPSRNDVSDDSISYHVLRAVAAYTDQPLDELPSLDTVINVDALNNLFKPRPDGTPRTGGKVIFRYAGCQVTVHPDGEVDVDPLNSSTD